MSHEKDDYSAANEALIKRETQKFERAKARAESLENNMTKGLAAALREQRQKLAAEAARIVNRQESGNLTEIERKMLEAAKREDGRAFIDEGIITGYDQPNFSRDDDDF